MIDIYPVTVSELPCVCKSASASGEWRRQGRRVSRSGRVSPPATQLFGLLVAGEWQWFIKGSCRWLRARLPARRLGGLFSAEDVRRVVLATRVGAEGELVSVRDA
jgi:hypothetical protein